MEHIVVGTDLSQRSSAAVTMAASLPAKPQGDPPPGAHARWRRWAWGRRWCIVPDHGDVLDAAKGDLDRMAEELRKQGLTVESHTPVGEAADALCSVAETIGADLIVVGNKRMQGAALILGSVPNRVAHKATCSVLIARTG